MELVLPSILFQLLSVPLQHFRVYTINCSVLLLLQPNAQTHTRTSIGTQIHIHNTYMSMKLVDTHTTTRTHSLNWTFKETFVHLRSSVDLETYPPSMEFSMRPNIRDQMWFIFTCTVAASAAVLLFVCVCVCACCCVCLSVFVCLFTLKLLYLCFATSPTFRPRT